MGLIFLCLVFLIAGYVLGAIRRNGNLKTSTETTKDVDSYSIGYYKAINDIRQTARVINSNGEAAPLDKVLTTLLGDNETPQYVRVSEGGGVNNINSSSSIDSSSQDTIKSSKSYDTLPNVALIVGAVLILASASLFTLLLNDPFVTAAILLLGVFILFILALKFTALKNYLPAGLTFLGLSIALVPVAISPIDNLGVISKWIISSLAASVMLAVISKYRNLSAVPYVTTVAFFSLVMSIGHGLTDDIFWSFVVLIFTTLAIYLVRSRQPLYIASKFESSVDLSTSWVPGVAALFALAYLPVVGVEKLHIILALVVSYYLIVWLKSGRYMHEAFAKLIGLLLLTSITYEHILPISTIYVSLSFALLGIGVVVSSLVGWNRTIKKPYIYPLELAWLVSGFVALWYACVMSFASSGGYLFASVLALIGVALSLISAQVTKKVWLGINSALSLSMAVISISLLLHTVIDSRSTVYFISSGAMTVIGLYLLWTYYRSKGAVSYIVAISVIYFSFLAYLYASLADAGYYRIPELLVAGLLYLVAYKYRRPVLYMASSVLIFSAVYLSVVNVVDSKGAALDIVGLIIGLMTLLLMTTVQKPSTRKWILASIILLSVPSYLVARTLIPTSGSYETLKYTSLVMIVIGAISAHLLRVREGAVKGVKLAYELSVFGLLLIVIEFLRIVDIGSHIHYTVYAHLIGVAIAYSAFFIYKGSQFKQDAFSRYVLAVVAGSSAMAFYALEGSALGQTLFLVEHGVLLALGLRLHVRWLVYFSSLLLVIASLWMLKATVAIVLFLVGVGLIYVVVRSVSKANRD